MKILTVTCKVLFYIFTAFCLCVCGYWIYHQFNDNDLTTTTIYLNSQETEDGKFYFIEVNDFTNKNENGKQSFEVNFTGFTDSLFSTTYSVGYQSNGEPSFTLDYHSDGWSNKDFYTFTKNTYYSYDTSNNKSFGSVKNLGSNDSYILNLGTSEEPYPALIKTKKNPYVLYKTGFLGFEYYMKYDSIKLIKDLYKSIRSLEFGTNIITMDLSKYFDIYPQIQDSDGDLVWSKTATTDEQYVYVQVKVNKSSDGIIKAAQSLYSAFANNPDWSIYDSTSYWKNEVQFDLSVKDFDYINIEDTNTYCATLKTDMYNYLNMFHDIEIVVYVDLDSSYLSNREIILVGFSEDCFKDLEIKSINIYTSAETSFIVPDITQYNYVLHNVTLSEGGAT